MSLVTNKRVLSHASFNSPHPKTLHRHLVRRPSGCSSKRLRPANAHWAVRAWPALRRAWPVRRLRVCAKCQKHQK